MKLNSTHYLGVMHRHEEKGKHMWFPHRFFIFNTDLEIRSISGNFGFAKTWEMTDKIRRGDDTFQYMSDMTLRNERLYISVGDDDRDFVILSYPVKTILSELFTMDEELMKVLE